MPGPLYDISVCIPHTTSQQVEPASPGLLYLAANVIHSKDMGRNLPSTFGLTFSFTTFTCASDTAYFCSSSAEENSEYRPDLDQHAHL
jgi:hypothetical protein